MRRNDEELVPTAATPGYLAPGGILVWIRCHFWAVHGTCARAHVGSTSFRPIRWEDTPLLDPSPPMLHRPSLNISADGRRAGPPRPSRPPSTPRVWFQPPFPPIQRQNLAFTLTLPPLLERSGSDTRTPCSLLMDTEPRGALRCARTLAHARRREDQPSSRSRLVLARPLRHISVPGAAVAGSGRSLRAATTGPAP